MLALAHLRYGETCAQLAAGVRVGVATVYRSIRKAVDILAASPRPSPRRGGRHECFRLRGLHGLCR